MVALSEDGVIVQGPIGHEMHLPVTSGPANPGGQEGTGVVVLLLTGTLLLEAAGIGVEVLECTGVEVLTIPAVLDDANPVVLSPAVFVCAAVLVMAGVGDEGAMALEAAGAGVVVVLAAPVLLFEA